MQHKISIASETDNNFTVALSGEVDASVYDEFDAAVLSRYEAAKRDVTIDCADLNFIDSTILGGIVKVYKRLHADGKRLVVKNLSPRIRKLFEICALDKLVELQ